MAPVWIELMCVESSAECIVCLEKSEGCSGSDEHERLCTADTAARCWIQCSAQMKVHSYVCAAFIGGACVALKIMPWHALLLNSGRCRSNSAFEAVLMHSLAVRACQSKG